MYRFLECTLSQYMTRSVKTVTRRITLRELEALFEQHDFNAFPIVEERKMVGIITKFDFLCGFIFTTGQMVRFGHHFFHQMVHEVMIMGRWCMLNRHTIDLSSTIDGEPQSPHANRQLVGIISREDIMRALREATTQL
jgi:CBS-domain-containing membrane protein